MVNILEGRPRAPATNPRRWRQFIRSTRGDDPMAWEKKVATGQPQVGKNGKPLTPQEQAFNKRDAGQFTKLTFTRADNTSRDPIADPHLVVTLPNLGKVWISATPNGVTMQGEVDRGADGKANIQRRLSPDEIRAVRTA